MGRGDEVRDDRRVFVAGGPGPLAADVALAGWVGVPGPGDAVTGFARSGARIAVVDARGGVERLADATARLAARVEDRGAALLAIVPRADGAALRAALAAGATHVAVDPSPDELAAALDTAARHVRRLARSPGSADRPVWEGPEAGLAALDARLAAASPPPAALLVAIERFDVVNAAYGRRVGDQLLRAVAARLDRVLAGERGGGGAGVDGPAVRVGGSEYCALAPPGAADAVAGRIAARLADPVVVDGSPVTLGHRIATLVPARGEGAAAVVERLRDRLRVARGHDGEPATGVDTLAADLHRAIERNEIEMLYQPQVRLADGRIVGVEALARWEHPRLGTLGAEPLFAAAAGAGLAGALSDHVQALALREAAGWADGRAALRLAINVSAQDVAGAGFVPRFLDRLAASGFPAGRLTVEVTETGLIGNLDAAAATLARLRAAGCRVALDDFGTGYSSLAYLDALPVDCLKIDRAITRRVTGSARDRAVLDGVVGIARALGLQTIAEGVETPEQRDRLAALGCDLYQGFLCAEPVSADALAALVAGGG